MADVPATRGETAPMLPGLTVKLPRGLEGFTPAQLGLNPLELRLVQSGPEAGKLRFGRETFTEVSVVFLKAHPLRVLLEGEDRVRPTCCSIDWDRPHESVDYPKSPNCPRCQYAQWDEGPNGRRIAPPCSQGYAFLGVRPDQKDLPFWFVTKKSAMKPARLFVEEITNDDTVQALCECMVKLTTEMVKTGAVVYYAPIFTVTGKLPLSRYDSYLDAAAEHWFVPRTQSEPPPGAEVPTGEAIPWEVPV
jgi:hypothetical protein